MELWLLWQFYCMAMMLPVVTKAQLETTEGPKVVVWICVCSQRIKLRSSIHANDPMGLGFIMEQAE